MTISLQDLRSAVIDYLNTSVTTSISALVADAPNVISPNEGFAFSVTATNAPAPTGVQLTDVVYHLKIASGSVAKLQVPTSPPARASTDSSAPTLTAGTFVTEMYLFPANNILGVGDTDTVAGLRGKAFALGQATITFDVYADIDLNFLFPRTTSDPDSTRLVTVV